MPDYLKLPTTTKGLVRVVIETPRGAAAKMAYDPAIQAFAYIRPLPVGMTYPYDWGFIPSTLGEDGDPLDGLVIHQAASAPRRRHQMRPAGRLAGQAEGQGWRGPAQ